MLNILVKELMIKFHDYIEPFSKIREIAIKRNIPIISPETVSFLSKIIGKYQPEKILEIGTAIGYSALIMAENLNKKFRIDTIDVSKPAVIEARQNIRKYNHSNSINVYFDKGINFLKMTKSKYNFIFIDAKKEEYPEYYRLSKLQLKSNGIIVLDNLLWQGKVRQKRAFADKRVEILRKFDRDFLNDNSGKTEIYEIGDGVGIYNKKI